MARILMAALAAVALLALALGSQSQPPTDPAASPLATQEVVRRMVDMNLRRRGALHAYTAVRHYHLEYHGLGRETAEMDVRVSYDAPGPKRLTVISESGSGMLRHHVLDPLLKVEQDEAQIESSRGSVFVPDNYCFTLVDYPHTGGHPDYVLAVTPRKDAQHRFVFRGKIWLDPGDFGLVRAEGQSVHSPSWWVTHFNFTYQGQNIAGFWMPSSDESVAHLRLVGHAVLDIRYTGFNLIDFSPVQFLAQKAPQ